MTDLLLRIGISNLCVSLALAVVAWMVQSSGRRPLAAYLLWLLVLAKLITPPILTLPVVELPWLPHGTLAAADDGAPTSMAGEAALAADSVTLDRATPAVPSSSILTSWWTDENKAVLVLLWMAGSAVVLAWSLVRVGRFHRLLNLASQAAPSAVQALASDLARRLELRTSPTIHTTSAHLSPMVWWVGGKVRIVLPAALPQELKAGELRWILAHELAHVRRGDHLVRWLEWLACVLFWWNPVAWWARRNLRANEEICCDALVLSTLNPDPHTYANSLLNTVEFLSTPALRPPAMASEVNSGGFLERRLKMIISGRPLRATPRWMHGLVVLFALAMLPLGIAQAQDVDAVGRRLRESVRAGEITADQARAMMDALRKTAETQEVERSRDDEQRRRNRAEYAEIEAKVVEAVKAGKLSREEAGKKLEAVKKELFGDRAEGEHADQRRRISREEYARAEAEIKKMVEAGRVKPEDARRRLGEMRRALAEQAEGEQGRKRASEEKAKKKYLEIEARIIEAVKAGKLTREEAGKKLEAVKKELFGGDKKDEVRKRDR